VDDAQQDLFRRFAAGEDAAFTEVYRTYAGLMFAVAMRSVGQRELAADVVQQAFVKAWRSAATFSADQALAPWLCTITRRTAIDVWRAERRHTSDELDSQAEAATNDPSIETVWEAWQVRQALDDLPGEEREVVHLAYLEGLTHTETAERLGIPLGTVKSRSHRAHKRLSGLLAHLGPGNPTGQSSGR
jgi:RNA polymerase sigma-70 factor (ECF subfamily)